MSVRWPWRSAAVAGAIYAGRRRPTDLEPWLDTIHRLAQSRTAERRRLAAAGDETRRRLRGA